MAEYASGDRAIVFVSHNMHHIRTLCQRALLLDRGDIVAEGDPNRVISRYKALFDSPARRRQVSTAEDTPIRITGVKFYADGVEARTLGTGQDLLVEIRYEAREEMPEVGFTVAFYGVDGGFRTGYSTALDSLSVGTRKGEGTVRLAFPEFGIEPGSYEVSVGIWECRKCGYTDSNI